MVYYAGQFPSAFFVTVLFLYILGLEYLKMKICHFRVRLKTHTTIHPPTNCVFTVYCARKGPYPSLVLCADCGSCFLLGDTVAWASASVSLGLISDIWKTTRQEREENKKKINQTDNVPTQNMWFSIKTFMYLQEICRTDSPVGCDHIVDRWAHCRCTHCCGLTEIQVRSHLHPREAEGTCLN